MKTFIGYALIVIGVPVFGGLLLGSIVALPVARLLVRYTSVNPTSLLFLEVFNGLGAAVAATVLCHLFALTPGIGVLAIILTWSSFYFLSYRQSKRALSSWIVGMVIGWLIFPRLFAS